MPRSIIARLVNFKLINTVFTIWKNQIPKNKS